MRSRRYLKSLLAVAASVLLTGMLMGQGCPQSVTITLDGSNLQNLLSSVTGQGDQSGLEGTFQGVSGMGQMQGGRGGWGGPHGGGEWTGGLHGEKDALLWQTYTTAPITATFTPTATGQIVEIAVAANDSASRVTLTVTDPSTAVVATSAAATSSVSKLSFTPETAGAYTLTVTETGTAATKYAVLVTQPLHEGAEGGHGLGGSLLYTTFAAAPVVLTFTATDTTEAIRVALSGDNSASRITFTVTSPSGTTVASVTNPSTSTSSVSFTPSEAGVYALAATETGTASTVYAAKVSQSSQHGHP